MRYPYSKRYAVSDDRLNDDGFWYQGPHTIAHRWLDGRITTLQAAQIAVRQWRIAEKHWHSIHTDEHAGEEYKANVSRRTANWQSVAYSWGAVHLCEELGGEVADVTLRVLRIERADLTPVRIPQARFWVSWNGSWTGITLAFRETIELYRSERHEEGWSSEWQQYTHEGDLVSYEWCDDGTDCDGRLTRSGDGHCPLTDLRVQVPHELKDLDPDAWTEATLAAHARERAEFLATYGDIRLPKWQSGDYTQRDEYAEAMGY